MKIGVVMERTQNDIFEYFIEWNFVSIRGHDQQKYQKNSEELLLLKIISCYHIQSEFFDHERAHSWSSEVTSTAPNKKRLLIYELNNSLFLSKNQSHKSISDVTYANCLSKTNSVQVKFFQTKVVTVFILFGFGYRFSQLSTRATFRFCVVANIKDIC